MPSLLFLGACATVTGSKYLLATKSTKILVDCGLFQGSRDLKERNWAPFAIPPSSIDRVVLTHAHIDHTGYLPRLVAMGFKGPVTATPGTIGLLRLLLPDSGHLQEEDAAYANKEGYARHKPALPLYTEAEARHSLTLLERQGYDAVREVAPGVQLTLRPAGHILGSALVEFRVKSASGEHVRVLFTGDLGRPGIPILVDPARVAETDYLVLESTYGGREHDKTDPRQQLLDVIESTVARRGVVLIPSFAVGRAQEVLYYLNELFDSKRLPPIPVYLDSPMAVDATRLYTDAHTDHDEEMEELLKRERNPLFSAPISPVRTQQESKALNHRSGPMIIVSASGMATGGRVLHHLKRVLPDERSTVLFVGYQAAGTRGRKLVDGATEVELHGQRIPVRAQVKALGTFSAHADTPEILEWLGGFERAPKTTFLVHGEDGAREALAAAIRTRLGWNVHLPALGETAEL